MAWKNDTQSWGRISIIIHWLTAITVISLFAVGWWMTGLTYYHSWYKLAPDIHKSVGILLFGVTLFRVIWRHTNINPTPLATHTKHERLLAHLMHITLYALLFLIMISGYLISTADGRAISVFELFEIPAITFSFDNQEDIAGYVHFYLACTLIIMAILHGLAAIKHHVINKDTTLIRMLKL